MITLKEFKERVEEIIKKDPKYADFPVFSFDELSGKTEHAEVVPAFLEKDGYGFYSKNYEAEKPNCFIVI